MSVAAAKAPREVQYIDPRLLPEDIRLRLVSPEWRGLTPAQLEAQDTLADYKHACLVGGSRSGKTFLIVRQIVYRAMKAPGSRHLATRLRGNAVRASVWLDTFPTVMRLCYPHVKWEEQRSDGYVAFPNNSQLWFGGLDDKDRVEKILGQEYATIYAGECSQIPYASILVLRTRLAQNIGLKLRGFYDLNPTSSLHWTNVEFGEKRDPMSGQKLPHPEQFGRFFINPDDNADNLDPDYIESLRTMPTLYRQRFYEGKYVTEIDGALWSANTIELVREDPIEPPTHRRDRVAEFNRIVIGVDPSGATAKADKKSDEIGIVAAGRRNDNKTAAVLEDATVKDGPKGWATAAVAAYKRWHADLIVAEANYGGEMVRSTIKAVDANVPVKLVHASRGKHVRAEPIAALYEEKRVNHCGHFPRLEEQLSQFTRSGYQGATSPDRGDALVWALSELMIEGASSYNLNNVY